jgi:hypothetical protein
MSGNAPLLRAFELAQLEINSTDNADVVLRTMDELLSTAAATATEGSMHFHGASALSVRGGHRGSDLTELLRAVASFTRDVAMTHLNVCHLLLVHLTTMNKTQHP